MKILSITLLVSAALGSIGLAGCQTTEEDYYYGGQPRRVVSERWDSEETVYVRRPQPVYDYGYSRETVYRQPPPRWQAPPPPPPQRWQAPPPPPQQHWQAPPPPPRTPTSAPAAPAPHRPLPPGQQEVPDQMPIRPINVR